MRSCWTTYWRNGESAGTPGSRIRPTEVGIGHYVGILAPENAALRDRMNEILLDAMKDGRLEAIFRRWNMWNDDQPRLYARLLSGESGSRSRAAAASAAVDRMGCGCPIPSSARARGCRHLCAVVSVDGARCCGRSADRERHESTGPRPVRTLSTAWVELIRGTPLLLQLFVLYFGLAVVVELPAFLAALIGLGLNYAAYESEIYRGALEAVPTGQLDAARARASPSARRSCWCAGLRHFGSRLRR